MTDPKQPMLASGQGGNDVVEQQIPISNIFDRICQMGNSTVTSDTSNPVSAAVSASLQTSQFAASLQGITDTMQEMRRDLDQLRNRGTDQIQAPPTKRARISGEGDEGSLTSSDQNDLIDNFLDSGNVEAPEGDSDNEWLDMDFFVDTEETGDEISPDLAILTNKVLRSQVKEEKAKLLIAKHKRPGNVENLQVPRVEEQLWRQLKRETKAFDYAMQKSQASVSQAIVPVLKMMQKMKQESVSAELKELAGDVLKMLAQTVVQTNETRVEKIKRDLLPAYRPLCSNKPSATKLFGDKLQADIQSLKETKTTLTSSNVQPRHFLSKRGRGSNFNPYPSSQNRGNHGQSSFHRPGNKQNLTHTNNSRNGQNLKRGKYMNARK